MGAGKSGKHTGKAVINVESRLELSVDRGSLVRGQVPGRRPVARGGHVHSDPFQGLREKGSRGVSPADQTCDVVGDGDLNETYRGSPLSLLSAVRASATWGWSSRSAFRHTSVTKR